MEVLAEEVGKAHMNEYVMLWVHPLNVENLRKTLPRHFEEKSLRILQQQGLVQARPTLSFRTLDVPDGYYVKLPVPLQLTSWPRYVSPVEIQESAVLSKLLPKLDLTSNLVMLPETWTCHLSFEDTQGVATYPQARYCSMLVRDSPLPLVRDGHRLVPLAATFSTTPAGCMLWEEIWATAGIGCSEILNWFARYVQVVAECQIIPFLRYGLIFEAHQQNALVELSQNGWLTRLFYREIGGGIEWDRQRLDAFPDLDFSSQLYARHDMFIPLQTCHSNLRHTLLESHLLPLADKCSSLFSIATEQLHDIIRLELSATIQSAQPAADDLWKVEQFEEYARLLRASLLEEACCKRKALLRMRLSNTKDPIFIQHTNRLALVSHKEHQQKTNGNTEQLLPA